MPYPYAVTEPWQGMEGLMKAWKTIIAALMFAAAMGVVQANAAGTPEEAKALAEKASGLVKAEGDKAFATLSDPNGDL
jgi:hypothetical protein